MPKLTKKQFEEHFRDEVLPHVIERYEQDGIPDKPARRETWNDTVDAYIRDRQLPEAAGNWSHPRWLETYRPRGSGRHYSTVKTRAKFSNKQIGGYLQAEREPLGMGFNDNYNKATYGITKAEYDEIRRAMNAKYGMFPERSLAGVRKALEGGRQHSTIRSSTTSSGGDWWSAGQRWLEREAPKEAAVQKRAWVKSGRSPNTFRYNPPEWHRDAVAALGRNDEETFKAIKLGQLGTQGLPPLRGASRHHSTVKSPSQLDREITQATGIGTWKKSDQPRMSEHLDIGHAGARVKPTSTYGGASYEWSIWIGQPGRRVLHQSGETRTKAGAKGAAERKLAALR